MRVYYFDGLGFVSPCSPPSLDSSSLEAPSAVHHVDRMSSRRLPVIIFVSLIVSDYVHALCCVECMWWPEEVITLSACYCMSASKVSSQSSVPPSLPASSVFSPQTLVVRFQLIGDFNF